ncbi:hypothetical protein [Embleya sp. NBC_00896]|nr:hypothetical protein OG928_44860 [Embleya sp. NBC_00896]
MTPTRSAIPLGDMVDAGVTNVGEGERWFAEFAGSLTWDETP